MTLPKSILTPADEGSRPAVQAGPDRGPTLAPTPSGEWPRIRPYGAWVLRRLLIGHPLNGELQAVSESVRGLAGHLAALPPEGRRGAWEGFLAGRPDRDDIINTLAAIDPEGPPPEAEAEADDRCATLADLRRLVANTSWPWPGWLAGGVLNALAADPGTGKTILGMELARRLWLAMSWPDGGANPFPERSRTLWVPGDRHFPQLLDLAAAYGLPDEAVLFNAPPTDPVGGLELDDPATLAALEGRIRAEAPALVIVDTVGMTTDRNLCKPEDARAYFGPLMDLAGRTGVAILLLTHLSKDGEALGRRIVGACRTAWKMLTPDPAGQPDRRRLWVDKSYAVKPPPLGMTIAEAGCSFDFNPPTKPEPNRGGRPAESRDKARLFIIEALSRENDQKARALCQKWEGAGDDHSESAFWRARDVMVDAGELVCEGKPKLMHLVRTEAPESGEQADGPHASPWHVIAEGGPSSDPAEGAGDRERGEEG